MSRKNRPLMINWLGSSGDHESPPKIAARRIATEGCRLKKGVGAYLWAERNGDTFSLFLSFSFDVNETGVVASCYEFEDGFDIGNLPPITLAKQALADMSCTDSDAALSDLVATAVSKYCTLTIERAEEDDTDVVIFDIDAKGYTSLVKCPFAELKKFLEFVKTPDDDDEDTDDQVGD